MEKRHRPNVLIKNDFSIDHLLIHKATIYREQKVRNRAGGWETKWNKLTDLDCRFTVYNPQEVQVIQEQREAYPTQFKVFSRADEDIQKNDRLEFKGRIYQVLDDPLNPSFVDHHLEIKVKDISREVSKEG